MSVLTTTSSVSYTGTGAVSTYPLPFPVQETTHVVATRTVGGVSTVLTLGPDFSVDVEAGTVTLSAPLAAGALLLLERTVPLTQGVSFTTYGPFAPETHEAALDALVMVAQQEERERLKVSARVAAIESSGSPATGARLDVVEADVAALEEADTLLDGRLDSAEATVSGHTTTLASHTFSLGNHTSRLAALEGSSGAWQESRVATLEAWRAALGATVLTGSAEQSGTVPPGEFKPVNIPVPGAQLGNSCLVVIDSALSEGFLMSSPLAVSDGVSLSLFNFSPNPISYSATFTAKVLQS